MENAIEQRFLRIEERIGQLESALQNTQPVQEPMPEQAPMPTQSPIPTQEPMLMPELMPTQAPTLVGGKNTRRRHKRRRTRR